MEFVLENDLLKVTVTTRGAQIKSVVHKKDGVEHIWCADPEVWPLHAPILFPYVGALKDMTMEAKGKVITDCPRHGFDREIEHRPVFSDDTTVVLELTENGETLALWPFCFRLVSTFTLEGDTVHHTLTVENRDRDQLSFGIGFHPAFAIPFDSTHQATDYEVRFDAVESPLCLDLSNGGLVGERVFYMGKNLRRVPIDEKLFEKGSYFMTNLASGTVGLFEKDSDRGVLLSVRNFPYFVLWSKPGMSPRFVCLEPWHSTPSPLEGSSKWEEKPAAAILAPGEDWSTTLSMAFVR